jgi:glycosyltransferase involved in cell wall biosynthesis
MKKNNIPFFSIIIPTYNRKKFLKICISSILNQDFKNYEMIIIDDGSSDGTKEEVEKIKSKKIRYFYQKNSERSVARNYGKLVSRGKYIIFCDSDDYFLNNHLSTSYNLIKKHKLQIFCLGYYTMFENSTYKKISYSGLINKKLLLGNHLSMSSVVISKKIANKYYFEEDPLLIQSEDYLFWLECSKNHSIMSFNKVTSVLRMHSKRSIYNQSASRTKKRLLLFLEIVKKREIVNNNFNILKSSIFLFISLNYALNKKIKLSFFYLICSIKTNFSFLFWKKYLAILKKIIISLNVWN